MPLYRSRAPVINLDEGLSAIGKAFAPPTPQDFYLSAKAATERGNESRIAKAFAYAEDPNYSRAQAERYSYSLGQTNGTNGYYAQDRNNATTLQTNSADNATRERTNAVDNAARERMNAADNKGKIAAIYATPIHVKEGETIHLPKQTQDGTGLAPTLTGTPTPLTRTQVEGGILQRQSQADQDAAVMSNVPVETVATSDGARIVFRNNAVGQAPAPTTGERPVLTDYTTPDGRSGTARYEPNQGYVDTQNGQKLPQGSRTLQRSVQAATEEGLGTSTQNQIEQGLADAANVESTAKTLRGLIEDNPASQGIMGLVRGYGQNIAAVAREGGKLFTPAFNDMQRQIAKGLVDPEIVAQVQTFDPSIPQIKLYEMLLAGQVAKMIDPNGRVSNDRMKQVTESLGGSGFLSNADQTKASLDAIQAMVANRRAMFGKMAPAAATLGQGVDPQMPARAAPGPASGGSAEGTIIENDAGQRMVRRGGKWEAL